jgi:hypothetical protein
MLELGSDVSEGQIVDAMPGDARPGQEAWGLIKLKLAGMIERAFLARMPPRRVVVVSKDRGLHICTDEEAAIVLREREYAAHVQRMRNFRRAEDVDAEKLSPDNTLAHQNHVAIMRRKLLAEKMAVREHVKITATHEPPKICKT